MPNPVHQSSRNYNEGYRRYLVHPAKIPFFRRIGLLTSATVSGQILLVATSPLLARLYSPVEFGLYGVFFALLLTLGTAAALRYDQAILATEDDEAALEVLALAIICSLITGLVAQVLFSYFAIFLTSVTLMPAYLWHWLPAGLTASGLYWSLTGYAVCRSRARDQAIARFMYPAAQIAIQLTFAGFNAGATGLAAGQVLGLALSCFTLWLCLPTAEKMALFKLDCRQLLAQGRRFRQFPLISTPATLLNTGGRWAPTLLLGLLYGAETAGFFYLAQRTLAAPVNFVGVVVGQTYLGEARRLRQEGKSADLLRLFSRLTLLSLAVSLVFMTILLAVGRTLFISVFGQEWSEAGLFAQLLAPLLAVRFVVSPVSATFSLVERQTLQLPWEVANLVALALGFAVGPLVGLSAAKAVLLYSLASVAAYVGRYFAVRRILTSLVAEEGL
jgi:lipopolysaccharide exporter